MMIRLVFLILFVNTAAFAKPANNGEALLEAANLLNNPSHSRSLLEEAKAIASSLKPKHFARRIKASIALLELQKPACVASALKPKQTGRIFDFAIQVLSKSEVPFKTIVNFDDFEFNFNACVIYRECPAVAARVALVAVYTQLKEIDPLELDLETQFGVNKEDTPEQLMKYGHSLQTDSLASLARTIEKINETRKIGTHITSSFAQQENQTHGVNNNLHEIDDDLNQSNRTIQRMNRRENSCCVVQ